MSRILISRRTVERLLELDATVSALRDRHPELFNGNLWRELLASLYLLRFEVGNRA